MQEINPEIFSENKWSLIREIAALPQSPTDLAAKTETSLSNVIQQLKLLEAYEIVRKEKTKESGYAGKPKSIYFINSDFVYAALISDGEAGRKYIKLEGMPKTIFRAIFALSADDLPYMLKFQIKHEDILKKCKALGFIKSSKDTMELFLITDFVDEIRSKFSNLFIEDSSGKTKKIINWTHNEYEINDGLNRKDRYFMDMLKHVQIIHDPQNIMLSFKDLRGNM